MSEGESAGDFTREQIGRRGVLPVGLSLPGFTARWRAYAGRELG
jgi:hypothetical protein